MLTIGINMFGQIMQEAVQSFVTSYGHLIWPLEPSRFATVLFSRNQVAEIARVLTLIRPEYQEMLKDRFGLLPVQQSLI